MLDFVYFVAIHDFKKLKIFNKLSKFPTVFTETSQAPTPPPPPPGPQRPYNVSRGQNRYVMRPLIHAKLMSLSVWNVVCDLIQYGSMKT